LAVNVLHGVISQKIISSLTSVARTSNPTYAIPLDTVAKEIMMSQICSWNMGGKNSYRISVEKPFGM
jgi:hypothetical protein